MVMLRRDPIFLLALLAALGVHFLLLGAGNRAMQRSLGWWLDVPAQATNVSFVHPPPLPPQIDIGEHHGTGKSINSLDASQPMQSPDTDPEQEQALADRAPVGAGKSPGQKPLAQTLKGENGDNSPQRSSALAKQESALASPPAPKSPKSPPIRQLLVDPKAPNLAPSDNPLNSGPLAAKLVQSPPQTTPPKTNPTQQPQNQQQQQDQQQQQQQQQQQAQANGGAAGSPESSAGRPIPQANFESVPIAMAASQFQPGKTYVRNGRKLLTREIPDLTVAGWLDVDSMGKADVVLRLWLDETGNVVRVRLIHSSGSDNIDLPCERAAETWWFEPKIDPDTGKPVPDELDFIIAFK
jgi:TonB family protein